MSKHTPGPWKLVLDGEKVLGIYAAHQNFEEDWSEWINPNGETIVETDGGHYPPNLKDAQLIAAAPDLLEALESVVEAIVPFRSEHAPDWWKSARADIAAAKGGA